MQSFSAKIKLELCRTPLGKPCCQLAELYGMLLFAAAFSNQEIRIVSEQNAIIHRAAKLLYKVCAIRMEPVQMGTRWMLQLNQEIADVMQKMGYDFKPYVIYHLNRNVIEDSCCAAAFLRGMFLLAGSVSSPEKKCHLEIKTGHIVRSREVTSLLLEYHLHPKMTQRRNIQILYWKDSRQIENFLTLIGARQGVLALMQAKVEKQIRNTINRQVNCETANLIKATSASAKQIAAIERALSIAGLEAFPEHLRQTVDLRVAYPQASLSELAVKFTPPISKSGLSHRLSRIMEIAAQLIEQEG